MLKLFKVGGFWLAGNDFFYYYYCLSVGKKKSFWKWYPNISFLSVAIISCNVDFSILTELER